MSKSRRTSRRTSKQPIIVKAYVPEGVALPEANLVLFGARDLFDEPEVSLGRPQRAEIEGFGISL